MGESVGSGMKLETRAKKMTPAKNCEAIVDCSLKKNNQ